MLERLQDALRRRDIWLENSDRWGDPRRKLLQGREWQAQRVAVCRALGHHTDGRKAVQQLAVQLDETWKTVSRRFDYNDAVSICHDGKYPSLNCQQPGKTRLAACADSAKLPGETACPWI